MWCLQETYFSFRNTHRLRLEGEKRLSIQMKWKNKINFYKKNLFKLKKNSNKRQRTSLYNNKEVSSSVVYNIYAPSMEHLTRLSKF